ncbi:MAG: hypothetical protein AAGF24_13590, partial [Cyanobacteria bacterium P01_H01_bin.121]
WIEYLNNSDPPGPPPSDPNNPDEPASSVSAQLSVFRWFYQPLLFSTNKAGNLFFAIHYVENFDKIMLMQHDGETILNTEVADYPRVPTLGMTFEKVPSLYVVDYAPSFRFAYANPGGCIEQWGPAMMYNMPIDSGGSIRYFISLVQEINETILQDRLMAGGLEAITCKMQKTKMINTQDGCTNLDTEEIEAEIYPFNPTDAVDLTRSKIVGMAPTMAET